MNKWGRESPKIRTNRSKSTRCVGKRPLAKLSLMTTDIFSANFQLLLDVNLILCRKKFYDTCTYGEKHRLKKSTNRTNVHDNAQTASDGSMAHYWRIANLDLHLSHRKSSHESQLGPVHYRTSHKGIRLLNVCTTVGVCNLF